MTDAIIDVCVCTYRRPSLADTLRSLAALRLDGGTRIRVVVADNDETPSARELAVSMGAELGLDLHYVHAPARNISIARNACLDNAQAPFAAFIDDDETATRDWLSNLLTVQAATGADVVLGRVQATYPADLPGWLAKADLHSIRPVVRADGTIDTGYTSNVLFRTAALEGLRFDPALGRSGGEDTMFFHALHARGARLEQAKDAVVFEIVTPARGRMTWLVKRAFRSGQTHALMLRGQGLSRPKALGLALAKAGWCAAVAAGRALTLNPAWRRTTVRGALHVGVISRLLGWRDLQLY